LLYTILSAVEGCAKLCNDSEKPRFLPTIIVVPFPFAVDDDGDVLLLPFAPAPVAAETKVLLRFPLFNNEEGLGRAEVMELAALERVELAEVEMLEATEKIEGEVVVVVLFV